MPFFCECGTKPCPGTVWLTLPEASQILERGGPIIGAHFFEELGARLVRGA